MPRKEEVFGVTIDGDISGLKKVMNEAVSVFNSTERSLKKVNKALELDPTNTELITIKQELMAKAIKDGEDALIKLKEAKDKLEKDPNFQKGVTDLNEKYIELQLKIKATTDEVTNLKKESKKLPSKEVAQFKAEFEQLGKSLLEVSQATKGISNAFKALLSNAFDASVGYESSIADIKRVVSDLSDETIEDLKRIAVETGNTFDSVAEYATIGGALGIAEKELASFAKTMTDLNTATGGVFSGEEGAKGVVVFLKQLGLSIDELDNFGSAIAVIGDKYADIGDETVNLATKLSGLASIVNTNQYELIGLAGVMSDLGLSADTNANGVNRAFLQIEKILADTSKKGQEKLNELATTAGLTSKEFKQAWNEDAMSAFLRFTDGLRSSVFNEINDAISKSNGKVKEFADALGWSVDVFKKNWEADSKGVFNEYIEALGEMEEGNESAATVLKDLGISSVNTAQTLLRLSGNGNAVREAIQLANDAWNENTALTDKANGIYDTTERKLQGLKESFNQMSAAFTDNVLPYVKQAIDFTTDLMKAFAQLDPATQGLVVAFVALSASFSSVTGALGKLYTGLTGTKELIKGLGALFTGNAGIITLLGLLTAGTVAWAFAMSNTKTPAQQVNKEIDDLRKEYEELNLTLDNNTAKFEYQMAVSNENAKLIDEYIQGIKQGIYTEEEDSKLKKEITDRIEKLNEQLGENVLKYDEVNNILYSNGEPVLRLTEEWEDLADAIRNAYYIEQYQPMYEEALQKQNELMEKQFEARKAFRETISGYEDTYGELVGLLKNGNFDEFNKQIKELFPKAAEGSQEQTDLTNLINAYMEYSKTLGKVGEDYAKYESDIALYNSLMSESPEIVKRAQDALLYGFNVDPAKNDVEALQEKLDDLYDTVDNHELYNEAFVDAAKEQIPIIERELELAQNARDSLDETLSNAEEASLGNAEEIINSINGEGGIVETGKMAITELSDEQKMAIAKSMEEGKKAFVEMLNYNQAFADMNAIRVGIVYDVQSLNPFGLRGEPQMLYQSGGFNSGGFSLPTLMSSGNISINNSFVVNGANIAKSQLIQWADVITDRVNEKLGRMV